MFFFLLGGGEGLVSLLGRFVMLNNYLGVPVKGYEKELCSLLRKLELRKGRGVKVLREKSKPLASSI